MNGEALVISEKWHKGEENYVCACTFRSFSLFLQHLLTLPHALPAISLSANVFIFCQVIHFYRNCECVGGVFALAFHIFHHFVSVCDDVVLLCKINRKTST